MNIEIANRLLNLRKKNGYSQEELAEKIGISRQAVSKWERAESSPDTDNLIALSRLYQVSIDELLHMEESEGQPKDQDTEEYQTTEKKDDRKYGMFLFPYPVVTIILFFVLTFTNTGWGFAWLIYFTIPIYYGIAEIIHRRKFRP